ncbi:MAG: poly-gamma-glutamate system protein [candidate division Zixibacteria bacterium]|nr:poly-gamma-glutamate system protein [candidate division Zixibacteria bacterium]
MKQRIGKPSYIILVSLALLALLLFFLAEKTQTPKKSDYYTEKIQAAQLAKKAQDIIKQEINRRGLVIDVRNDPNLTGLIGPQYSLITTDRSNIRDKLIATNPNLAANLVALLHRAEVMPGDPVAVMFTGSFPGANIAVLAACKVLGVKPVIITSVGSSSYGATYEDFTWLDMEDVLVKNGLWDFRSIAASLGGGDDQGRGLSPEGRILLENAIKRNGVEFINSPNPKSGENALDLNIKKRIKIFDSQRNDLKYKAVINVGGGLAAVGSTQNARLIPPGFSASLKGRDFPAKGALNILAGRRIPVIHLLDMARFAEKHGLPIEVTPEPEIGKGPIFVKEQYSVVSTVIYTIILLVILVAAVRLDLRYYFVKNKHLFVRKPR